MKTLLTLILLFSTNVALAETCTTSSQEETVEHQMMIDTSVPKYLVGATICVKQLNGKETCFLAEKFKVVPRKQQFIVQKTKQKDIISCETKAEKEKNRISVMAGNGTQSGMDVEKTPSKVTIENKVGPVGGLQYQRLITEKISLGGQVQTNDSVMVNIGLDF